MQLFWELYHEEARSGAGSGDPQIELAALRARCDRALLITAAMWSFIHEKLGVSEEQLAERIAALDASDGRLDGRASRPAKTCRKCRRNSASRFERCAYCGEELS